MNAAKARLDAIVVGSGPNGLAAAILLASHGLEVRVYEAADTPGGGARSAELTLPGFVHDVCSAIQPLGKASPYLRTLALDKHGLHWIEPPIQLAHPLDARDAATLKRSVQQTSAELGTDARSYKRLMTPLVRNHDDLLHEFLGPLRRPRHPISMARFGLSALRTAAGFANRRFNEDPARSLFIGMAAHSMLRLTSPATAAFGLMLAVLGHAVGWQIPAGGSQSITDALTAHLRELSGKIVVGHRVSSLSELPPARATLLDLTAGQVIDIAADRLPPSYRAKLSRYRYGPGVFKLDLALDGPIPWSAGDCTRAGTVHVGGPWRQIIQSEAEVWAGQHPEKPFVLVAQSSLFDPLRAPAGRHTVWAYCHVPNGSDIDMSDRVEAQIERFAPGFRDRIIGRHKMTAQDMQNYNANYIGGDINGGVQDLRQLFTRPVARLDPYSTPADGIYICSSSTPPGGGVHGMCGYWAARSALEKTFDLRPTQSV